jgi:lipopolysaccharide biosynthesis glycosyltransferase
VLTHTHTHTHTHTSPSYWPGMFAATKSIVDSASRATQRRLHVHLLVDKLEGAEQVKNMQTLVDCVLSTGEMMRDIGVTEPFLGLLQFDSRDFSHNIKWSQSKNSLLRNLTSPHNFARFYLSDYLPREVRKVIWLDADVIVRADVATVFDSTLTDDDERELVFAACTMQRRFDFMLDMSPSSALLKRMPELAKCYQKNW